MQCSFKGAHIQCSARGASGLSLESLSACSGNQRTQIITKSTIYEKRAFYKDIPEKGGT